MRNPVPARPPFSNGWGYLNRMAGLAGFDPGKRPGRLTAIHMDLKSPMLIFASRPYPDYFKWRNAYTERGNDT